MLKDRFFWESYGKYSLGIATGLALATIGLDVPPEVSVRFGAGAIATFPAAYAFASRRKPDQPVEDLGAGPA
jgi:hypothetical protein